MRKSVLAVLFAALLLLVASAVMADATDFVLQLKASDSANAYSGGTLSIGWMSGYTDSQDSGERIGPPSTGKNAVICSVFPDTGLQTMKDYRTPVSSVRAVQEWMLPIYPLGAWTDSVIEVDIIPTADTLPSGWTLAISGVFTKNYRDTIPGESFTVSSSRLSAGSPAYLFVTAVPDAVTPEPSSLAVLVSALAGVGGLALRGRRRQGC